MSKTIKPQLLGFGLYLQMSGSDSLHFQIFGSVASQLQDLSSKIFQDSRAVHRSSGSHPVTRIIIIFDQLSRLWSSLLPSAGKASALEMSVNSAHRELQSSPGRPGDGLLFGFPGVFSSFSSSHGDVLVLASLAAAALTEIYFQTEPVPPGQAVASTTPPTANGWPGWRPPDQSEPEFVFTWPSRRPGSTVVMASPAQPPQPTAHCTTLYLPPLGRTTPPHRTTDIGGRNWQHRAEESRGKY